MNSRLTASFLALLLLGTSKLAADPGSILLRRLAIDPYKSGVRTSSMLAPVCSPSKEGTRLYILQPVRNFSSSERLKVEERGVRFCGNVPPNAYVVEASEEQIASLKADFDFCYVGEYLPDYKILYGQGLCDTASLGSVGVASYMAVVVVREEFYEDVYKALEELGARELERLPAYDPCIKALLTEEQALAMAERGDVAALEAYSAPRPCNDVAKIWRCCNLEDFQLQGYDGEGQVVCVQDTGLDNGDPSVIHPDFKNKRVWGACTDSVAKQRGGYGDWSDAGSHGTHVAGSVCGSGQASNGQYRGMASKADIFCLCAGLANGLIGSGTFANLTNSYVEGARVMNNSWGSASNGSYDYSAVIYDWLVWNHKDYTVCFSSGNNNKANNGVPTISSIMSASAAKNIITVGASETYRPEVSWECRPDDGVHQGLTSFSSRGPCTDGRIKPDIVAPGTAVHSTLASSEKTSVRKEYYHSAGGTSMSSPIVAGCCTVIRDYLVRNRKVASPSASLVKAVLLSGGRTLFPGQYAHFQEIPEERPNSAEGHGHVNVQESLEPVDGKMDFAEMELAETGLAVTNYFDKAGGGDLAVLLVWTDYPGGYYAEKALVNDLDLFVTDPSGKVYNPGDHVDNVESVRISGAPAGRYAVVVKAHNIMQGPQPASLVFNYGCGNRQGKLAFVKEPAFAPGSDVCDLLLTNLVSDSYISADLSLSENSSGVFSLEESFVKFKSFAKVRLTANLLKTEKDYAACRLFIAANSAGSLERLIGAANGSEESGYVLYKADYSSYPYNDTLDYDGRLSCSSGQTAFLANATPLLYDCVKAVDFEDYAINQTVIGQQGWTLGTGNDSAGLAYVYREHEGGKSNTYLRITSYSNCKYAPHLKVEGIEKGWAKEKAHRYYKISFRARMKEEGDAGDRAVCLYSPSIATTTMKKAGHGFTLYTSYQNGYEQFQSNGYFDPDVWVPCSLLIEAVPENVSGSLRHALRHVRIGDFEEDCHAFYSESNTGEIFSVLRFYLENSATMDIDDIVVERYCSDETTTQGLLVGNPGTEAANPGKDGLNCAINVPEGLDGKYDLVVKASVLLDQESQSAVIGQDSAHRQFQSELKNLGGQIQYYLTDYQKNPGLIQETVPVGSVIQVGYRINAGQAKKLLRKIFLNGQKIAVDDEITSQALSKTSAIEALRFCLPGTAGSLKIYSLEASLLPIEKAKLCLAPKFFLAGQNETVWTLTNACPGETISYRASITGNSENFSVTPAEGTFKDLACLTIKALNTSTRPDYEWAEITIEAGSAGTIVRRFGHPLGNPEDGYVLYREPKSPATGLLGPEEALWSGERSMTVERQNEEGTDFLRFTRLSQSPQIFDSQGCFVFVGAPAGSSSNLDLRVRCKMRYPNGYKGYFYFTQDEASRQFQTSFSSVTSKGETEIKTTCTDYTRNTGLITEKLKTDSWYGFELLVNALPSQKTLREITVGSQTKVEEKKIGSTKLSKSDAVDFWRFQLTGLNTPVDIKDFEVAIVSPVPEPLGLALLGLILLLIRRR